MFLEKFHARLVRRVFLLVLVLAALVLGLNRSRMPQRLLCATEPPPEAAPAAQESENEAAEHEMELVTVGMDMVTRSPVVLLRQAKGNQRLPVWVGILEAQGIMRALQGIQMPRPMTHDLMATLLEELGGTLERVTIDELRDGTYHGKLTLRIEGQDQPRILDTRPSDGMALALRTGAAIYVNDEVLKETPDILFVPLAEGEQVVSTLGITVIRPTEDHREQFDLPETPGVLVIETLGEAQRLGLQRGDLIIQVDDQKPTTPMEFFEAIQAAPGKTIQIRYLRGDQEDELELPAEMPVPPREPRRDIA
ncbi:MAG: PDZ domain-containing protein [Planctomycetaceae bacterium]|nr:MAG: PDZ domain-containing protein [Planctomycetaceae bacterium]